MIQFLDALAFFFIITLSVIGFRRGFIEELGRFLSVFFATIFALEFYIGIGNLVIKWVPIDIWVSFVLSFITIFSVTTILIRFFTKLIQLLFLSKSSKLVNKIMGTILGFAKGLLSIMIFFWTFELIPDNKVSIIFSEKSNVSQKLIKIRKSIVTTFNWDDPIDFGEKSIRDYLIKMKSNNG